MPTDPPTTAAELPAVQIWLGLANHKETRSKDEMDRVSGRWIHSFLVSIFVLTRISETDSGNIREQSTVKMGPWRDSPCIESCYIQTFSRPLIDTSHKSRVYLLRMWGLLRLHLGLSIYIYTKSVQTNTKIALQFLQFLHQSSIVTSSIQIFMTNIKLMFPASVSKSKAKACGACCPPSASFPLLPGRN